MNPMTDNTIEESKKDFDETEKKLESEEIQPVYDTKDKDNNDIILSQDKNHLVKVEKIEDGKECSKNEPFDSELVDDGMYDNGSSDKGSRNSRDGEDDGIEVTHESVGRFKTGKRREEVDKCHKIFDEVQKNDEGSRNCTTNIYTEIYNSANRGNEVVNIIEIVDEDYAVAIDGADQRDSKSNLDGRNQNEVIMNLEENSKDYEIKNDVENGNESKMNHITDTNSEIKIEENSEELSENEKISFDEAEEDNFFDSNFSDFQQANKDVNEHPSKSLGDIYKELKKYEENFLNQVEDSFHQKKQDFTTTVIEKSMVNTPDLSNINSIFYCINGTYMSMTNKENSVEELLHENIIRYTEQEKETNKKLRTNKNYYSLQDYLNSIPSNPNPNIVKEFKGSFNLMQ